MAWQEQMRVMMVTLFLEMAVQAHAQFSLILVALRMALTLAHAITLGR